MRRALVYLTAALEIPTGLALVLIPDRLCSVLLGLYCESLLEFTLCRLAGGALVALGVACWSAARSNRSRLLVPAALLYNLAAALVLGIPWVKGTMAAPMLLPAVILHTLMTLALLTGIVGESEDCPTETNR